MPGTRQHRPGQPNRRYVADASRYQRMEELSDTGRFARVLHSRANRR
jgi:hypothetical protein